MEEPTRQNSRGYARIREAAKYIGLGERTVRSLLKAGELPHYRLRSGTILIAYGDIDEWIERYKVGYQPDYVEQVVEEITSEVLGG